MPQIKQFERNGQGKLFPFTVILLGLDNLYAISLIR